MLAVSNSGMTNFSLAINLYVDVIHGDIKPENVLIFEKDGCCTAKVTDFGYSTSVASGASIFLPRSAPWQTPEYHHRQFLFSQALKAEVYSFGLLCLWLLFGDQPLCGMDHLITTLELKETIYLNELFSGITLIEKMKDDDQLRYIAEELVWKDRGVEIHAKD